MSRPITIIESSQCPRCEHLHLWASMSGVCGEAQFAKRRTHCACPIRDGDGKKLSVV
jgi:hypothetical protein